MLSRKATICIYNCSFTNENSVFLVGGLSPHGWQQTSKQVQSINFDGVDDLTSAQQKQWIMLGTLTYEVSRAGVQFYSAIQNYYLAFK